MIRGERRDAFRAAAGLLGYGIWTSKAALKQVSPAEAGLTCLAVRKAELPIEVNLPDNSRR
jgi:hypothetical protein